MVSHVSTGKCLLPLVFVAFPRSGEPESSVAQVYCLGTTLEQKMPLKRRDMSGVGLLPGRQVGDAPRPRGFLQVQRDLDGAGLAIGSDGLRAGGFAGISSDRRLLATEGEFRRRDLEAPGDGLSGARRDGWPGPLQCVDIF